MEPVLLVIPNAGLSIVALTMAFESSDRGPCYGDIITTYLPCNYNRINNVCI